MNLVTGASKPSDLPVLAVVRGCEASVLRAVDHTGYTDRAHHEVGRLLAVATGGRQPPLDYNQR